MKNVEDKLQAHWEKYKEMVIPKNAGEVQIRETKKAFYSGALIGVIKQAEVVNNFSGREIQEETEKLFESINYVAKNIVPSSGEPKKH